jgi:hypothetical protein
MSVFQHTIMLRVAVLSTVGCVVTSLWLRITCRWFRPPTRSRVWVPAPVARRRHSGGVGSQKE